MKNHENAVIKKGCHSRGMLSGIYNACRYHKKEQALLNRCMEDPRVLRTAKSGMTPNLMGFTLIELLVVVLIIGILAAVAVPQYQKAVEKSKATQAITLLKSVYQAGHAYYLATGNWPTSFEQLDIDIPWTGTTKYVDSDAAMPTKSNEDWSLQIRTVGTSKGFLVGRLSGPYAGTAFAILYQTSDVGADIPTHKLLCIEGKEQKNLVTPFTGGTGTYCQKIMNANVATLAHASKYFTLS